MSGASNSTPSSPASTSSSLTSSELELIEQLKRELAAPLFTAVSSKFENYQNRLQYAELKIRVLEERLRLLRKSPGRKPVKETECSLDTSQ